MNNKILRDLSYGVYVVGSLDGERKVGCVANSAMQITSNPAKISQTSCGKTKMAPQRCLCLNPQNL